VPNGEIDSRSLAGRRRWSAEWSPAAPLVDGRWGDAVGFGGSSRTRV
jgi:hypothetical protein